MVRLSQEETGHDDAIVVVNDNGRFYALDDTCTHAHASLADGWVEDGHIECPLHGGQFCLRTGEATATPAVTGAVTHPVEADDGRVWLVLNPGTDR